MKEHEETMERILRELWANGGPQRATSAGTYKPKLRLPSPALTREQRRLIKTWKKNP